MIKLKDILHLINEHCTIVYSTTDTLEIMDWYGDFELQKDLVNEIGDKIVRKIYCGINQAAGVCIII